MSIEERLVNNDRRAFMSKATVLSATAVAMLAGCESAAKKEQSSSGSSSSASSASSTSGDVKILNVALGLEHQAIAAYQVGAESGLLSKPVLNVAVGFQSDHKEHRDLLTSVIRNLGGSPVEAKSNYNFDLSGVKNQADVLAFALGLEEGAAKAYLSVVPSFGNRDLAKAAADLCASEAMHCVVLRKALGKNPAAAPFFSKTV